VSSHSNSSGTDATNDQRSNNGVLTFYGGLPVVALAPIIFIGLAIYNLVFLEVYDTTALVGGGSLD